MTGSDWVGSDSPSLLMAYTSNLYRWPGLRLRTVVEVAGAVTCNQTFISGQSVWPHTHLASRDPLGTVKIHQSKSKTP